MEEGWKTVSAGVPFIQMADSYHRVLRNLNSQLMDKASVFLLPSCP